MKFRKKPVVVEAFQWKGSFTDLNAWLDGLGYQEDEDPAIQENKDLTLTIFALEGEETALLNDWIVRGIVGEFYPIKPDIFEATYGPVE